MIVACHHELHILLEWFQNCASHQWTTELLHSTL